jgi:hypothetical protein
VKSIFLAAALSLAATGEALACLTSGVTGAPGETVDTQLVVKSGSSCSLPYRGGLTALNNQKLTQRPAHGTAVVTPLSLQYRPKAGYVGKDQFVVEINGNNFSNTPTVWRIRFNVIVTK